jgi:hypothetical protein
MEREYLTSVPNVHHYIILAGRLSFLLILLLLRKQLPMQVKSPVSFGKICHADQIVHQRRKTRHYSMMLGISYMVESSLARHMNSYRVSCGLIFIMSWLLVNSSGTYGKNDDQFWWKRTPTWATKCLLVLSYLLQLKLEWFV